MCGLCPPVSRRFFCSGLLTLPLLRRRPDLVEPVLRLNPLPPARTVAITLDACPGRFDPRVAGALVSLAIPATIFVTRLWMQQNPEGWRFLRAHPDLFAIENHGANHLPPILGAQKIYGLTPAGSLDAIRAEVEDGADAIAQATGARPQWYRAAAGLYSPAAIPFIQSLGFRIGGYSLNADAGASLPAASVAARLKAARNGEVTEGHINQPTRSSGAGLAQGLAALKAAGCQFVRLDQLDSA